MYPIGLCLEFTGLCNQLFAFVSGVLTAKNNGFDTIAVGPFSIEIHSNTRVPIDKILDITETSELMDIRLVVANVKSGMHRWSVSEQNKYIILLRCIRFAPIFYNIANDLFEKHIDESKPIHVVHLRVENDAIQHWSKMNNMFHQTFSLTLHEQYRKAIYSNIPEGSQILVLTGETDHLFVQELYENYMIFTFDSRKILEERLGFTGRELCAIVDLILGSSCTGVFIGCHNLILKRGSTFSFTVWQLAQNAKMGVFIDLDDVSKPLQVWYK